MKYNNDYSVRKTIFGRIYLANKETGDVIDINQITVDILELIKQHNLTIDSLIDELCKIYDATPGEIRDDVEEIIHQLMEYNVIF